MANIVLAHYGGGAGLMIAGALFSYWPVIIIGVACWMLVGMVWIGADDNK